jgi:hypothetical protein
MAEIDSCPAAEVGMFKTSAAGQTRRLSWTDYSVGAEGWRWAVKLIKGDCTVSEAPCPASSRLKETSVSG